MNNLYNSRGSLHTESDDKRNQKYKEAYDRIKANLPCAVVRTEKWTETIGDMTIEHEKTYDAEFGFGGQTRHEFIEGEVV